MHRPKEIAERLAISPATLRLWSNHFAELLSPAAQKSTTESGTSAQRRYTDSDLVVLQRAKELLSSGHTYEESLERLKAEPPQEQSVNEVPLGSANGHDRATPTAMIALTLDDHPIVRSFREAIDAKDETIRAKEETIAALQAQVEELKNRPLALPEPAPAPVRFRWDFLNRLLLDSSALGDREGAGD